MLQSARVRRPGPCLRGERLYRILDREVAGVIASSLAYGRASQIVKSARRVLDKMRGSPRGFLLGAGDRAIGEVCEGFRHRFTDSRDLLDLLLAVRKALMNGVPWILFASGSIVPPRKPWGACFAQRGAPVFFLGRNNSLLPDLT